MRNGMGAELGVVIPHCIQPHVRNDILAELYPIAGLARCCHDFVTVNRDQFVLVLLYGDDLLNGRGVAAKHHEIGASQAHQEVHDERERRTRCVS